MGLSRTVAMLTEGAHEVGESEAILSARAGAMVGVTSDAHTP